VRSASLRRVLGSWASARIVAIVPLQSESGDPSRHGPVDDRWTAIDPTVKESYTDTELHPGFKTRYTFKGASRLAAVTGIAPPTKMMLHLSRDQAQ
jgi:hypothetical protein